LTCWCLRQDLICIVLIVLFCTCAQTTTTKHPQALGSVVTASYADSAQMLLSNGMVISMGLSGGLLYVSHWIGGKFDLYTSSGYVVGQEEEDSTLAPVHGKKHLSRVYISTSLCDLHSGAPKSFQILASLQQ